MVNVRSAHSSSASFVVQTAEEHADPSVAKGEQMICGHRRTRTVVDADERGCVTEIGFVDDHDRTTPAKDPLESRVAVSHREDEITIHDR